MQTTFAKQNSEREVKTYHCTRWNFPKLDGFLTVTTERVIFHGSSKTVPATTKPGNRIVEEAELKSVSGISSFYGTKFNWIWAAVGLVLLLGGLIGVNACAEIVGKDYLPMGIIIAGALGVMIGIVAFVGGILIIVLLAFQKAFFLNIYSSQSAGTPISIGNAKEANHVLLSLCGKPTEETDQMMNDLGAMIIDLKADKKQAYEEWSA